MARDKKRRLTRKELIRPKNPSRREFLKKIGLGSGGILFFNGIMIKKLAVQTEGKKTVYSLVVVDFNKCTGCRTCETVCSAFNHSEVVNEKEFAGLGNPYFSNIRVYPYNPDVDVPVTYLMCDDAPCLEACPVETDPKTGHRAIYREGALPILRNDLERCIGCGSCAEACLKKRVGVIIPNPQTHKPERMCTLCNGDPLCVKYCPYGALSYMVESTERKHYGFSPNQIAEALTRLWFNLE